MATEPYLQSLKYKEVTVAQSNSTDDVEIRKEYYVSGVLEREIPLVNGQRHGIEKVYYSSGALGREIHYVNGKRYGIDKTYYESGALKYETPYVNGKIHGIRKEYYSSGALWEEIPYKKGKRHGRAKCYDEDNLNIDCIKLYKRDREVLVLRLESYGTASTKSYI